MALHAYVIHDSSPPSCAPSLAAQELLNQTSHYSEKVRKQALGGLSDLFTRHPEELKHHTHAFFVKVAERVRKQHPLTACWGVRVT